MKYRTSLSLMDEGVDYKKYLNVTMLADYIKLSKTTIYQLVTENRIPHLRVLNKVRFDIHQIDEWMQSHRVESKLPKLN